jgi:hypothetical protein
VLAASFHETLLHEKHAETELLITALNAVLQRRVAGGTQINASSSSTGLEISVSHRDILTTGGVYE